MQSFGVIGNPIAHSLSPVIHNFLFSHFKIQANYQKIHLLSSQELKSTLARLKGANITLPYKEDAFKICDEVFGIAQEIGAVNTILYKNQRLLGFNTDGFGFWECIRGYEIKNALIIGAGGSAKAVAVILRQKGIEVSLYNRTLEKLNTFATQGFEIGIANKDYDLLINATSAGMDGISLPLEKEQLKSLLKRAKLAFDLIYPQSQEIQTIQDFRDFLSKRQPTAFISFVKEQNAEGKDGLEMLLYQALYAFEIFCENKYRFEELQGLFYNSQN